MREQENHGLGSGDRVVGLDELITVIGEDPLGPWVDAPHVDAFLAAHRLSPGDVVEMWDADGPVAYLGVTPRGLRWLL